jgi:hypothetical protein
MIKKFEFYPETVQNLMLLPFALRCYPISSTLLAPQDISSPSLDSSPQRGPRSDPSSPYSTRGTASCSSNMTTASTQRTEALQTKDALFSKKKREVRKFPDLSGVVDMSASFSRFEEVIYCLLALSNPLCTILLSS